MDRDTILKLATLILSLAALIVSGTVAWRDKARPKIIIRRGLGRDFTPDKPLVSDLEVMAILVVNLGRRPLVLDTVDPLRLVRADGTTIRLPDTDLGMAVQPNGLTHVIRRPIDGRLGERDGFFVLVPLIQWVWFRLEEPAKAQSVQLVDITGKVRAETRLPREVATWFNQDQRTDLVGRELQAKQDEAKKKALGYSEAE